MTKPESTIERYLVRKVREARGMAVKLNPIGMAGLPDRLILLPREKMFFVEVKAPGKKPRPIQTRMHEKLSRLGFRVEVADSNERVKEILRE